MPRQMLVIGLGQFGMALARALAQQGCEVLAIDNDEARIAAIAPHVADAVLMDAMDETALASLGPAQRDACVCAIGDDNREGSIVVTALLKQMSAPQIIARATDDVHARILRLVGADQVIHPERDHGERLAIRLAWRNVVNVMALGEDLVMTEIQAPESFWGHTLAQLCLPKRYTVTVAAIRRIDGDGAGVPDAHVPLKRGDILMLVSAPDAARRLTERS